VNAEPPKLYFDLGSPYAYVAAERAESVLGRQPVFEPILLGAIFQRRGRGSWAMTGEQAQRMRELEERARRYQLPPFVWPEKWPANTLAAMRAAVWAKQRSRVVEFSLAVFRRQFVRGMDITDTDVLGACARDVGLDAAAMLAAIKTPAIKEELKVATDRAWCAGVQGVPTVVIGGDIFYGDDRLEAAASKLGR
jgi:2-hydroxychromene-2-carboxylate isomerase